MLNNQNSTNDVVYKGFDPQFCCRGFQYEVGSTYELPGQVVACSWGFHACQDPLDVWTHYPPTESRFAMVEQSGNFDTHHAKICSSKITIRAELTLGEFIQHAAQWGIDRCTKDSHTGVEVQSSPVEFAQLSTSSNSAKLAARGGGAQLAASGEYAYLSASGEFAKLAAAGWASWLVATGEGANLAAVGYHARLVATGPHARLVAAGISSRLAASGPGARLATASCNSQLAASGVDSHLVASGEESLLAASGEGARLAATGRSSRLSASGPDSVIVCSAFGGVAKGAVGTWIALADYEGPGKCVGFVTGRVGHDGLEPDVYYAASGGKFVKAPRPKM